MTLKSVEVYGTLGFPLAMELAFGPRTVVLAVGYTHHQLEVSDGDEVLVLSSEEFAELSRASIRTDGRIKSGS